MTDCFRVPYRLTYMLLLTHFLDAIKYDTRCYFNVRSKADMSRCGDAFPIEGVLVATYLLSVEALPHCRCGVANKSYMV